MEKGKLIEFVKEFNKSKGVSTATIMAGLKELPESDHELFMALVNYKNGTAFKSFIPKQKKGK